MRGREEVQPHGPRIVHILYLSKRKLAVLQDTKILRRYYRSITRKNVLKVSKSLLIIILLDNYYS